MEDPHGSLVLTNLNELKISYSIHSQLVPGTVTWKREDQQTFTTIPLIDSNVRLTDKYEDQRIVLLLLQAKELIDLIKRNELLTRITNIQEILTNKEITLIIFGLRDYCRKNSKEIGRRTIEVSLTELQLLNNVSHRLLETAADFGLTVSQFSKSIAEEPFKAQHNEKYNQEEFFILNDNRDCVKVQDTNGLTRLWQQHLIKLPLATLETAEAIIKEYPLPQYLLEAYEKCDGDREGMLSDIPVRRRAEGPLSNVRKIGPEMSRKIYNLYQNCDPEFKI